jgi:hypothetical protein
MENDQPASLFEMQADQLTQTRLNSIASWGKFISITALILAALTALVFFAARKAIADTLTDFFNLDRTIASVIFVIIIVACVFFIILFFFLLKASMLIRKGVVLANNDLVAEGFKYMRIFFVMSAVVSILSILGTISGMINS